MNWNGHEIKGVKCTDIEWCVEEEDVIDTEGMTEEEIYDAVANIEAELPEEVYVPIEEAKSDCDEIEEFLDELDDILSDKYGWLVTAYNFILIGTDGKEYKMKNED